MNREIDVVSRLVQACKDFLVAIKEENRSKELIAIDEIKNAVDDFEKGGNS